MQTVCWDSKEARRCGAAAALLGSSVVLGWELVMEHGLCRAWSVQLGSCPTQRPVVFLQKWPSYVLDFLLSFEASGSRGEEMPIPVF